MGRFDNALLMTTIDNDINQFREYEKSAENLFFDPKVLEEVYGISNILNQIQNTRHYESEGLGLKERNRLVNLLLMAEVNAGKTTRIYELTDFTSPAAIARKQKAARDVLTLLTTDDGFGLKLLIEDGTKFFRKTFNRDYSGTVVDYNNPDEVLKASISVEGLVSCHMDGFCEYGKVGVTDYNSFENAHRTLMFSFINDRKKDIVKIKNKPIIFDGTSLTRSESLIYLKNKACIKYGIEMITSGEVDKNPNERTVNPTALELAFADISSTKYGVIGKLSNDELSKLMLIPSLRDAIQVDFSRDITQSTQTVIKLNDITLYDTENTTVLTDNNDSLVAVKELINREYAKLEEKELGSQIGSDCFANEEYVGWLIADIKDAGIQSRDELHANTSIWNSSEFYRDMEKAINSFNDVIANANYAKFADEASRKQITEKLNDAIDKIDKYFKHKNVEGGYVLKPGYETDRYNAAKAAMARFTNIQKYINSANKYFSREDILSKASETISAKYSELDDDMKDIAGMERVINRAEEAAQRICILGHTKNNLTEAEKKAVIDGFETMCVLAIKSELANIKDKSIDKYLPSTNDRELKKMIRTMPKYKDMFSDKSKIDASVARDIISNDLEYTVRAEFKRNLSMRIKFREKQEELSKLMSHEIDEYADMIHWGVSYEEDIDNLARYIAYRDLLVDFKALNDNAGNLDKISLDVMCLEGKSRAEEILESDAFKKILRENSIIAGKDARKLFERYHEFLANPNLNVKVDLDNKLDVIPEAEVEVDFQDDYDHEKYADLLSERLLHKKRVVDEEKVVPYKYKDELNFSLQIENLMKDINDNSKAFEKAKNFPFSSYAKYIINRMIIDDYVSTVKKPYSVDDTKQLENMIDNARPDNLMIATVADIAEKNPEAMNNMDKLYAEFRDEIINRHNLSRDEQKLIIANSDFVQRAKRNERIIEEYRDKIMNNDFDGDKLFIYREYIGQRNIHDKCIDGQSGPYNSEQLEELIELTKRMKDMSKDELATEILKHVLDVNKDDINNPEKIYEQFIEEIEQRYAEMDAQLEDEEELEEEIEIKDEPKVKENEKAKVSEEPQLKM